MKKVLVTGSGTGFGHEVAMRLAEKGLEAFHVDGGFLGAMVTGQLDMSGVPSPE